MKQVGVLALALTFAAVLAAGCAALPASLPRASEPPVVQPAPTVNPAFAPRQTTPAPTSGAVISGTLSTEELVRQLLVEPTPAATSLPAQKIAEEPLFDDTLHPDWSMEQSIGMRYSITQTEKAYTGNAALTVTPLQDFGTLFFTVKKDAKETYGLDRVAGVSVWIHSGDQPLDPNNLSVTVIGSNDYPYWVPEDKSVKTDETHFFSESRLIYLGINNTVPPNTWVEAVVWLDKLPYEPDYKYITGIYIKNDEWFRRTFYVDRIHLLVVE